MAGSDIEHFDVIIVGAGVSGIGAACHLRRQCPDRTFAILEGRDAIGGTWDLFRYPGIRSDSDMHTFGYNFKPWLNPKSIADGPSIRAYVHEAAAEHAIGPTSSSASGLLAPLGRALTRVGPLRSRTPSPALAAA